MNRPGLKKTKINPRKYKQSHTPTVVHGGGGGGLMEPLGFSLCYNFFHLYQKACDVPYNMRYILWVARCWILQRIRNCQKTLEISNF